MPYRVSKRACWYSAPHRFQSPKEKDTENPKHKGTVILWPDFVYRGNSTPICEAHARHYYGNKRVNQLIAIGAIKVWEVSGNGNTVTQNALGVVKGEMNNG